MSDEYQRKTCEAARRLCAEFNEAAGFDIFEAGQPLATFYRERFSIESLRASVKRFHALRDEATGATLHADVWKRWRARKWK